MKLTKNALTVLVACTTAISLSACASGSNDKGSDSNGTSKGGSAITIAETNAFTSGNPDESSSNTEINTKIMSNVVPQLQVVNPDLKLEPNPEVGKIEKISDNPLTVKYTISDKMKWTDDKPVSAADLMLSWAIGSGRFDDATLDEKGEVKSGNKYFNPAGDTTGLSFTGVPTIGDNGKSLTVVYEKPYADWQIAMGIPFTPAHIVAKRAGIGDEQKLIELFQNTPKGDPKAPSLKPEIKKVADVWNKDWQFATMPSDPDLLVAAGPFKIKQITEGQSLTLVKNEKYGGTPAKLDEVTIRTTGDPNAAIQALRNKEADIIAPQASNDTIKSVEALDGVKVLKGPSTAYDHIDLSFEGVFADPNVRKAFLLTIPRQGIVDKISKPLGGSDKPLDSLVFLGNQESYADSAANNGSSEFAKQDIDKAKQLLAGKTPEVRIMYNKDNANRVDTFNLIRDAATQAGFKIVDNGQPKTQWGKTLGTGTYDASIFGWVNTGVGISGLPALWKAGGGNNHNKYNNPKVNELVTNVMFEPDQAKQIAVQKEVDKLAFADGYGLPLFQSTNFVAFDKAVKGIDKMQPNNMGVFWNLDKLSLEQ